MAFLYFTAALRESVTTIALALPSSRWATLAWKCSTMICTFWLMLVGCSRTHRIRPLRAAPSSTSPSPLPPLLLRAPGFLRGVLVGVGPRGRVEYVPPLDGLLHRVQVELARL